MIDIDTIKELPLNHSSARRLVTWTWNSASADLAANIESALDRWSTRHPGHVLTWSVDGTALGRIQASAVVQWRQQYDLSRRVKEMTAIFTRRYGSPLESATMESVRIRQGGNLRRIDGTSNAPTVPGEPDGAGQSDGRADG